MTDLSFTSQVTLYIILFLMASMALIIFIWQLQVWQGKAMKNADGSVDSWQEQKILYGAALADLILACPLTITGIVLIFIIPNWGHFLLILVSFWFVWANIMTTATSLRFENPRFTLYWIVTFPFGILIGISYLVWFMIHFSIIASG